MPTLTCPRCKSAFSVPETTGDFKTACPKCKATIAIKGKSAAPLAIKVDDPVSPEAPVTHPVARFTPPTAQPMVPIPPPEPIVHQLQEVACQGCNRPIGTLMECSDCRAAFCSEACLERHFRLTRHGFQAPAAAPVTMHAPAPVINVVVQNENVAHSHAHSHARAQAVVTDDSSGAWGCIGTVIACVLIFFVLPLVGFFVCCGAGAYFDQKGQEAIKDKAKPPIVAPVK